MRRDLRDRYDYGVLSPTFRSHPTGSMHRCYYVKRLIFLNPSNGDGGTERVKEAFVCGENQYHTRVHSASTTIIRLYMREHG